MNEEFVRNTIKKAFDNGSRLPMDDANQLWNTYKQFMADQQPDMIPLIEQHEYLMKKHFISAIDIFTHVPKFLIDHGVSMFTAARVTQQLEYNLRKELSRMLAEEKDKK
jgi:hypothetical protein